VDDPARPRRTAPLALAAGFALIYLVWGSTYLAIRFAVETIPPFLMAGGRFLIAGTVLYVALRLRGEAAPSPGGWRFAAVTGALLLLGGNAVQAWAQQWVPSGLASLVVGASPLWFVALDWLAFRGPRPASRVAAGIAVGFAGLALLTHAAPRTASAPAAAWAAMVLAPLSWALGSLLARRRPAGQSPFLTSATQMLVGGVLMILVGTVRGEWSALADSGVSARSAAAFAYLTVVGSLVAFSTYIWLLGVTTPAAVSTYAYVNPLVAVLLGWMLAGEPLDAAQLAAGGVVLASVALVVSVPKPVPHPAPGPAEA
jgi:drug/metabolite transporter (DMT)-like permease